MRSRLIPMSVSLLVLAPGIAMADTTVTIRPQAKDSTGRAAIGTVQSVSPTGREFTMTDGTTLTVPEPSTVLLDNIRPGSFVNAAYETEGSRNVVNSISVQKSAPGR